MWPGSGLGAALWPECECVAAICGGAGTTVEPNIVFFVLCSLPET